MLLALLLSVPSAQAHEPGLSRTSFDGPELSVVAARADVADPATLLAGTEVTTDAGACRIGPAHTAQVEGDGLELRADLDCPEGARTLTAGWLDRMPPGHRVVVESEGAPVALLDAANRTATVDAAVTGGGVALSFLWLGIEHIVTGWDHLIFLGALLLVARSLREATGIVSGFTVAHSVTLSLAALGVVAAPAWVVEPAIALTILWVGVENLWDPPASRRFVATMILGLVHGFGFAGLLGELGMPAGHRLAALLAFNGGVELGQIAIVLVTLPLLLGLGRHRQWRRVMVPALSIAIALLGLFWFVERVAAG